MKVVVQHYEQAVQGCTVTCLYTFQKLVEFSRGSHRPQELQ
jgi:hypothetical protein